MMSPAPYRDSSVPVSVPLMEWAVILAGLGFSSSRAQLRALLLYVKAVLLRWDNSVAVWSINLSVIGSCMVLRSTIPRESHVFTAKREGMGAASPQGR